MSSTRPAIPRMLALGVMLLAFCHCLGSCGTSHSIDPGPGDSRILDDLIIEDYTAWHDSASGTVTVKMEWPVRFGRTISSTKLESLDFQRASIEEVTGGGFKYETMVSIPTHKPQEVTLQRWDPDPDEDLGTSPDSITTTDALIFHCPGKPEARAALKELQSLLEASPAS